MLWWDSSVAILPHKTAGSGADPQGQIHRLLSLVIKNTNRNHAGDWKPVLLRPTVKAALLGGVSRVDWPKLPPPQRLLGDELGAERPAAPSPSLLPLHSSFPLVSGWGRACLASLYAAREQHVPCLVSLQGSPLSNLRAQVVFPNTG